MTNSPNLTLLARASANFLKSALYQTKSKIQIDIDSIGVTIRVNMHVNTIAKFPNQFRSEIAFVQPNSQEAKIFLVVSNGKQVWSYHPGLKQYTITPYKKFNKLDESFFIGFSSSQLLQTSLDIRRIIAQGTFCKKIHLAYLWSQKTQ